MFASSKSNIGLTVLQPSEDAKSLFFQPVEMNQFLSLMARETDFITPGPSS